MTRPPNPLKETAAASRRRREWQAQEKAWREAVPLLSQNIYPANVLTKLRLAFTQGWEAASRFHTADLKGVPRDPTHPEKKTPG